MSEFEIVTCQRCGKTYKDYGHVVDTHDCTPDLTIRDRFAMAALVAIYTGKHNAAFHDGKPFHGATAKEAWELADAMIAARGKR
jgi:hypothetical protein